jgi:hypothetical protein
MSTPKTWDLIAAVKTCLQSILVSGGYYTDAGANVTLEPSQEPDSSSALLCVFLDGTTQPTDPAVRRIGRQVSIMVVGKITADQDSAQQKQHELLADIERAMSNQQKQFPLGGQYPFFEEAKFINRVEGLPWVGVAVRYNAHITRKT